MLIHTIVFSSSTNISFVNMLKLTLMSTEKEWYIYASMHQCDTVFVCVLHLYLSLSTHQNPKRKTSTFVTVQQSDTLLVICICICICFYQCIKAPGERVMSVYLSTRVALALILSVFVFTSVFVFFFTFVVSDTGQINA